MSPRLWQIKRPAEDRRLMSSVHTVSATPAIYVFGRSSPIFLAPTDPATLANYVSEDRPLMSSFHTVSATPTTYVFGRVAGSVGAKNWGGPSENIGCWGCQNSVKNTHQRSIFRNVGCQGCPVCWSKKIG